MQNAVISPHALPLRAAATTSATAKRRIGLEKGYRTNRLPAIVPLDAHLTASTLFTGNMAPVRILLCSLCLAAVAGNATAQALSRQIAEELSAASKARVRLHDGTWVTLDRPKADSTIITYRYGESLNRGGTRVARPGPLRVDQLNRIDVARGSHAGSGAKLGGAIGAGLGIVLYAAANAEDPGFFSAGDALQGTVTIAVLGAAVGALIGNGSPRWHAVYGAPPH